MSLSSASTLTQIKAEYMDTASYDVNADVSLCRRFVVACRILKMKMSMMSESGTREAHLAMKPEEISAAEQRAMNWLTANDVGGSASNSGGPAAVRANFNYSRN